jgi:hypothetical protein
LREQRFVIRAAAVLDIGRGLPPAAQQTPRGLPAQSLTDCDTRELRYDAQFEVKVHDGVYGVGACEFIGTLYEAIQLSQVRNSTFATGIIQIMGIGDKAGASQARLSRSKDRLWPLCLDV